jgi:hypothetical protein
MKRNNNIDGLFPLINWVLKKTQLINNDLNFPTSYLLNRWLSMSDKNSAIIINNTFNTWNNKNILFNNTLEMSKFLRIIMPTIKNKFSYIKKSTFIKNENDDVEFESKARECSQREIKYNKSLLDLLQSLNK